MLYQLSFKELWKESVCGHFFQMLPFVFFAANAILFKPRLNDVNFIPESLFCLSRDWATIKATLVKKSISEDEKTLNTTRFVIEVAYNLSE